MYKPRNTKEYRTTEFYAWKEAHYERSKNMVEWEQDLIAKAIRNNIHLSDGQKESICDDICAALIPRKQFFNYVRFKDIAVHSLPKGWPRE